MAQAEQVEVLEVGSGTGGKLLAWHSAKAGHRTAVVERKWIGGSCPNVNCAHPTTAEPLGALLGRLGGQERNRP